MLNYIYLLQCIRQGCRLSLCHQKLLLHIVVCFLNLIQLVLQCLVFFTEPYQLRFQHHNLLHATRPCGRCKWKTAYFNVISMMLVLMLLAFMLHLLKCKKKQPATNFKKCTWMRNCGSVGGCIVHLQSASVELSLVFVSLTLCTRLCFSCADEIKETFSHVIS